MPQDGYYLTQEDVEALRDLLEQNGKTVHSLAPRGRPRTDINDQEVTPQSYVVLTPIGGIPALTEGPDAGTALGTGDIPGSADCKIYRLLTVSGTLQLEPTAFTRKVYNLGTTAIAGTNWALVTRDGFGSWYATGVTTATGGGTSGIEIKENVGTADFTPTTVLIVNQTDGFQIVQTAGSTVRLDFLAASTTQKGAVTTGDQTWNGNKTINGRVDTGGTQLGGGLVSLGLSVNGEVVLGKFGTDLFRTQMSDGNFELILGTNGVSLYGYFKAEHSSTDGKIRFKLVNASTSGASSAVFCVGDSVNGITDGATAVAGPLEFKGGICTTASWPAGVTGTFGG